MSPFSFRVLQVSAARSAAAAACLLLAMASVVDALFFDFLPASRRGRANVNQLLDDNDVAPDARSSSPLRTASGGGDNSIFRSLIDAVMSAATEDEEVPAAQQGASFLELPVEEPLLKVKPDANSMFLPTSCRA